MTYVPLTRASTISGTLNFLRGAGVSVERTLAMADLPSWIGADTETLVPSRSATRVRGAAARLLGMPCLGLTVGERTGVDSIGRLGALVRRSPTLGAALQTCVRHGPILSSRGRMRLCARGDHVELARELTPALDPCDFDSQQTDQFIVGVMLALVRVAAGPTWRPAEVHFQSNESRALRDAGSLAGVRVEFRRPATMITIPNALLSVALSPPARTDVRTDADDESRLSTPSRDFVESIRQAIETLSYREYPNIGTTAEFLGMSVRTLQRGLAQAGCSHRMLVAQTRFATAAAVLERTDAKILDLALDLGYSDHANFTRAFRRWVGLAPRQYRSTHARRPRTANRLRRRETPTDRPLRMTPQTWAVPSSSECLPLAPATRPTAANVARDKWRPIR